MYEERVRPISAKICPNPPYWSNNRRRGKARAGMLYEEKVHEEFDRRYKGSYVPGLWLEYETSTDDYLHRCQPDGLLINLNGGIVVVVEVKLKHTEQAYWQLRNLYLPVLRLLFPEKLWKLVPCEVVKWFDPCTPFPVPVKMCREPSKVTEVSRFHVHIWGSQ